MLQLPGELQTKICSYLLFADLLTLSRTNKSLAAAVKPLLFETLTFHGDAETTKQYPELPLVNRWPTSGTPKSIEVASLDIAIDEVLGLDIARYTKTFQYSPRVYDDGGFWPRYREWVEEQADENIDFDDVDMNDTASDAWDSEEEHGTIGIRREVERRRARPEKERDITEKAELYWGIKVTEQEQKKEVNHAALVRLFKGMPALRRLRVREWSCEQELRRHGIKEYIDEEVGCQFSDVEILNLHLETLSRAVQESETRIRDLILPTVYGRSITKSPTVQKLFSALTSLSFTLHDPAEMLGDYRGPPPSFRTLIRCARNTLQSLEFADEYGRQYRGEHLLEKLWGYESGDRGDTIIFPKLKRIHVAGIILYAPSLIAFLQAQPTLEKATFTIVSLGTQGYGWPDVAAALPPTCNSLHIDRCSGESGPKLYPDPGPDSAITRKQVAAFKPHQHPLPEWCGWRERLLDAEREAHKHSKGIASEMKDKAAMIDWAQRDADCYDGPPIGELLQQLTKLERQFAARMQHTKRLNKRRSSADYERI